VDENGDVDEFDLGSGDDTGDTVESGEDVTLLVQCSGPGNAPVIKGLQKASKVEDRLVRLEKKIAERDAGRAEKLAALQVKREEKRQEKLDRIEENAPDDAKDDVQRAREPKADKDQRDNQGGGNDDKGGGNDNQGGGGGGNQGGGGNNRGGGNN
jgi:uncharacterized membrane protein YgcG